MNEDHVDDLTSLSTLNEAAVLNALRCRYLEKDLIYTLSGIVLISVNPYRSIEGLYSTPMIEMFAKANPEQLVHELPPHLYSVAAQALRQVMETGQNQTVVVSGESGAGKTVNARHMMRFFAMAARPTDGSVEERVLATNPLLEAFGNARTVMNDNSSRFGKYVQLFFDRSFALVGARLQTFLLEKTRVVKQAPAERNYHIFYQLLGGADPQLRADLELGHSFAYLNLAPEPQDVEGWRETCKALTLAGFDADCQRWIWTLLAAILHLGNLKFPLAECHTAARLLGVAEADLCYWLTHRQIHAGNEVIDSPLDAEQAEASRDALAKWLYAQLFSFLIERLNENLRAGDESLRFIGVLDIYGFECFESGNGLEQLCINWANERLQSQFIDQVFRLEQAIYAQEGIEWQPIDYGDNAACIELIEGKGISLVNLLDEETRFPKATDASFVAKVRELLSSNPHLLSKSLQAADEICIAHSAYPVTYRVDGWLERNRDAVSEQLKSLCQTCHLVSSPSLASIPSNGSIGSMPTLRRTTVSLFKSSLVGLMETILKTAVHYVRCIKPNDLKKPNCIDATHFISQLRACGIMETIRISAAGYPARPFHADFIDRYGLLSPDGGDNSARIESILQSLKGWTIGNRRVFLRAGVLVELEMLRLNKLNESARLLQSAIRRYSARNSLLRMTMARGLLQRSLKMTLAGWCLARLREERATTRLQTAWRMICKREEFSGKRRVSLHLSTMWRGIQAREKSRRWAEEESSSVIARSWLWNQAQIQLQSKQRAYCLLQASVHRRMAMRTLHSHKQTMGTQASLQQRIQILTAALHLSQGKVATLEVENEALRQQLAHFELQSEMIAQIRHDNDELKVRLDLLQRQHSATQSALFYQTHPPVYCSSTQSLPDAAVHVALPRSSSVGNNAVVDSADWNKIPAVSQTFHLLGSVVANVAG